MHDAQHDAAISYPFASCRHRHCAGIFHQCNFRHMQAIKALGRGG